MDRRQTGNVKGNWWLNWWCTAVIFRHDLSQCLRGRIRVFSLKNGGSHVCGAGGEIGTVGKHIIEIAEVLVKFSKDQAVEAAFLKLGLLAGLGRP